MKKINITIVILFFGMTNITSAQETNKSKIAHSPISIDINTGLYSKIRGKIEYRFKKNNAVLFSFSRYYGAANPSSQIYLEYRNYYSKKDDIERFFMGKLDLENLLLMMGIMVYLEKAWGRKLLLAKRNLSSYSFQKE